MLTTGLRQLHIQNPEDRVVERLEVSEAGLLQDTQYLSYQWLLVATGPCYHSCKWIATNLLLLDLVEKLAEHASKAGRWPPSHGNVEGDALHSSSSCLVD